MAEDKKIETYGDLRKALKTPQSALYKKLATVGIKLAVDLTGAGLALTALDMAKLGRRPDSKKTGTWLDKLDIDDKTSEIVDDTVENGFFKYMADDFKQRFSDKSDNERLPDNFSMDQELADYLTRTYDQRYVAGVPKKTNENKMDKKSKIKETLKTKLKQEMSGTGTGASVTPGVGAGVATKYAFGKRKNKGTSSDWKEAPSIPNRPSKAMDYKELWEEEQLQEVSGFKSGKEFINIKLQKYPKALSKVNNLINMIGENNFTMDMAEWIFDFFNNASFESPINEESLLEGYAQFRNETKMRSKPDQFHQAVKQVKKKVNEINRLFEYMDRLKTELSEGESELKYKKYTENALSQIKEATKKLFFKSTKLK
jgi:hypothetical protein